MTDTYAIIVAAGRGRRFGGDLPKQFCNLNGRPVLMHTIDAFLNVLPHQNIILVLDRDMVALWENMCRTHHFCSPAIVYGGQTRAESVKNGLEAIPADAGVALVHDGARPFVTPDVIRRVIAGAADSDGAIPCVALTDSIRSLTDANGHSRSEDRSRFVAVQTPQGFIARILRDAYSRPLLPTHTDDASVVESAGYRDIRIVEGDAANIKITYRRDLR